MKQRFSERGSYAYRTEVDKQFIGRLIQKGNEHD